MPEEEESEPEVVYLEVARAAKAQLADDGLLHPRSREETFAGAPRGPVTPLAERRRPKLEALFSLRGAQVAGPAAIVLLCVWVAVRSVPHGGGAVPGAMLALAVLIPFVVRAVIHEQLRTEFWWQVAATRGFELRDPRPAARSLPIGVAASPLFGPLQERVVEHLLVRHLADRREAFLGTVARVVPTEVLGGAVETTDVHRFTFVAMPLHELAGARWPGASIRADHLAQRPLLHRAMLGPLMATGVAGAAAHVGAAATQDPRLLAALADARLEQFLAEHPADIDLVAGMLVVVRDGAAGDIESIEDLCRTALLVHELVVAEHEVPQVVKPEPVVAMPPEDEPVIDLTREGWSEGFSEGYGEGYAEAA
jgi:hypothetical protein